MKKEIIVSLVLLGVCPSAYAGLIFEFGFSNATGDHVSGRIIGLEDDMANQAASNIFIDSFTGQTDGVFGTATNDATIWSAVYSNRFSVSSGQIVQSVFAAQDRNASRGTFCINLSGCIGQTSLLKLQNAGVSVGNSKGFGGVQFRNVTSVAEPGTVGLLGIGLIGLAARRLRRKVI